MGFYVCFPRPYMPNQRALSSVNPSESCEFYECAEGVLQCGPHGYFQK